MHTRRYILNASFFTSPEHRSNWENWLYQKFFPFISKINPEVESEVFEVLSDVNQDMLVFSVQMRCATQNELKTLEQQTTPIFNEFRQTFGETATNFNSILNKID
ncbi:MAG: DUF4286 family protein [Marinilabiliaceae bacterium]